MGSEGWSKSLIEVAPEHPHRTTRCTPTDSERCAQGVKDHTPAMLEVLPKHLSCITHQKKIGGERCAQGVKSRTPNVSEPLPEHLNRIPCQKIIDGERCARGVNNFLSSSLFKMRSIIGHLIISCRWPRSKQGGPSLQSWWACSFTEQSHRHLILPGPVKGSDRTASHPRLVVL